jgi:RNA polymerase sigma factor (sigma-70 family)
MTDDESADPPPPAQPVNVSVVYALHRPALLRYVRKWIANPQDVQDVLQDVWTRWLNAEAGAHAKTPRAWLMTTARNLVLDRHRRQNIVKFESLDGEPPERVHIPRSDETPLDILEREQEFLWRRARIALLPSDIRTIAVPYIDGVPAGEIMTHLPVSRSIYYTRQAKALELLQSGSAPYELPQFEAALKHVDDPECWMLKPWIKGEPVNEPGTPAALPRWTFYRKLELAMQRLDVFLTTTQKGSES